MVFSSFLFLCGFLPLFLAVYHLLPHAWRNPWILAASLLFFAWGAPTFVAVLLLSCAADYLLARRLEDTPAAEISRRRLILGAAVAFNLVFFLYFKYANFLVGEVNRLLASLGTPAISWTAVVLPLGISFITFHKISYLVDIHRGTVAGARRFDAYLLYILLFPQLIAGPILRYHHMAPQLGRREVGDDAIVEGLWRFCRGLGKKVLIANALGVVADRVFAEGGALPPERAWLGLFCYSFQIYFDFAGYSDMAFGLGRLMGFRFVENFNLPYTARSFTDFWRRWHISLSAWMREYLYIPLGGNRVPPWRAYLNLWIVFLLSGFWHGASWNFIVWGAWHGFFLTLDKLLGNDRRERLPAFLSVPLTFLLVTVGWVFFRAPDLAAALRYLRSLAGLAHVPAQANPLAGLMDARSWTMLVLAILISFLPAILRRPAAVAGEPTTLPWPVRHPRLSPAAGFLLLGLSLAALATSKFNPFIYFRF